MPEATDTLSTSTAPAATGVDWGAYFNARLNFSTFDAWRVAGPILQLAIENHSTDDFEDTRLNELVDALNHFEMIMLKTPAATLADVLLKLEVFFASDDEWRDGRQVKEAVLGDLRRLSDLSKAS